MENEAEEPRTEVGEEAEEGGPIKTFLEHLEDLRWVLIKSCAVLGVAVLGCLLGGNAVTTVLMWPLSRAKMSYPSEVKQVVTVLFETNQLGIFKFSEKEKAQHNLSTNKFVTVHVEPVALGPDTNQLFLALRVDTNSNPGLANKLNIQVINQSPAGAFLVAFQIALYAGVVISAPFLLYFIASFVFPALKMHEKKYIYRGMLFSLGLFMLGVSFCYFILMPIALTASVQYTEWLGFSAPLWRAEDYIGFVTKFMLGMGLGFQLPVVILVLVRIGVLNYRILSKARRYVIVVNFTLGAILTTPEVITQVLMALPMQILYEITVWITWYWERKEKKRLEAVAAAEAADAPVGIPSEPPTDDSNAGPKVD